MTIIRAGLKSLLHTINSARRLRLIIGVFLGMIMGNLSATLADGKPDAGPYLLGMLSGTGLMAILVVVTLEVSDKRSKKRPRAK